MKNVSRFLGLACQLALVIPMLGANDAAAQSFKIGYTDHELIIANLPDFQKMQTQLQQFAQTGQGEYQRRAQEFQAKVEDYQKKAAVMAEATRKTKEEELGRIQGELQQFLARKEQELQEKQMELMQPLLDKVQNAIDEVAKEQNIDLVLSVGQPGAPNILYRNDKTVVDLTEQVMRKLGLNPTASTK